MCNARLRHFKLAQIILAAITSGSALGALIKIPEFQFAAQILTVVLSVISLGVTGYMKGFDPGAAAQKHRDTAADIWSIRESYLSLLVDFKSGAINVAQARSRREDLQNQLASIYKSAPNTIPKAYQMAQNGLKNLEDYTFNSGEVDKFLPPDLKRTN